MKALATPRLNKRVKRVLRGAILTNYKVCYAYVKIDSKQNHRKDVHDEGKDGSLEPNL